MLMCTHVHPNTPQLLFQTIFLSNSQLTTMGTSSEDNINKLGYLQMKLILATENKNWIIHNSF